MTRLAFHENFNSSKTPINFIDFECCLSLLHLLLFIITIQWNANDSLLLATTTKRINQPAN